MINKKAQISLEIIIVLGILVLGALFFGISYLSQIERRTADVGDLDLFDDWEGFDHPGGFVPGDGDDGDDDDSELPEDTYVWHYFTSLEGGPSKTTFSENEFIGFNLQSRNPAELFFDSNGEKIDDYLIGNSGYSKVERIFVEKETGTPGNFDPIDYLGGSDCTKNSGYDVGYDDDVGYFYTPTTTRHIDNHIEDENYSRSLNNVMKCNPGNYQVRFYSTYDDSSLIADLGEDHSFKEGTIEDWGESSINFHSDPQTFTVEESPWELSFDPPNFQVADPNTFAKVNLENTNLLQENEDNLVYIKKNKALTFSRIYNTKKDFNEKNINDDELDSNFYNYIGPFSFDSEIEFKFNSKVEGKLNIEFVIVSEDSSKETINDDYNFISKPTEKNLFFEVITSSGTPIYTDPEVELKESIIKDEDHLNDFYFSDPDPDFDPIEHLKDFTILTVNNFLDGLLNIYVNKDTIYSPNNFKVIPNFLSKNYVKVEDQDEEQLFKNIFNNNELFTFSEPNNDLPVLINETCKFIRSTNLNDLNINYTPNNGEWISCDDFVKDNIDFINYNQTGQRLFRFYIRQDVADSSMGKQKILFTNLYYKDVVINVIDNLTGNLLFSHGKNTSGSGNFEYLISPIHGANDFKVVPNKEFYYIPNLGGFDEESTLQCTYNVFQTNDSSPPEFDFKENKNDLNNKIIFSGSNNCFEIQDFIPGSRESGKYVHIDLLVEEFDDEGTPMQERNINAKLSVIKPIGANFSINGSFNNVVNIIGESTIIIEPIINNGFGNYDCKWYFNGIEHNTNPGCYNISVDISEDTEVKLVLDDYSLFDSIEIVKNINYSEIPEDVLSEIFVYELFDFTKFIVEDESYTEEFVFDNGEIIIVDYSFYDTNRTISSNIMLDNNSFVKVNTNLKITSHLISSEDINYDNFDCIWKLNGEIQEDWTSCTGPHYIDTKDYPFEGMLQDDTNSDVYYYNIQQTINNYQGESYIDEFRINVYAPFNVQLVPWSWIIPELQQDTIDCFSDYDCYNSPEMWEKLYRSDWGPYCYEWDDDGECETDFLNTPYFYNYDFGDAHMYWYWNLNALYEEYDSFEITVDGETYNYLENAMNIPFGIDFFNVDDDEYLGESILNLPVVHRNAFELYEYKDQGRMNIQLGINHGSGNYSCEYLVHLCEPGDILCKEENYIVSEPLHGFTHFLGLGAITAFLGYLNYPPESYFIENYPDSADYFAHTGYFNTNCISLFNIRISDYWNFYNMYENRFGKDSLAGDDYDYRALEVIVTDHDTDKEIRQRIIMDPKPGMPIRSTGVTGGSYIPPGTGSCFNKNTLISTPNGQRPIQEIKVGDYVYSFDSGKIIESKVLNLWVHTEEREDYNINKSVKLHLSNSTIIEVTENHAFYDPLLEEYKQLRYFNIGDKLLYKDVINNKLIKVYIENIEIVEPYEIIYNLHVENTNNYFANNVLVHNMHKYPPKPMWSHFIPNFSRRMMWIGYGSGYIGGFNQGSESSGGGNYGTIYGDFIWGGDGDPPGGFPDPGTWNWGGDGDPPDWGPDYIWICQPNCGG